MTAVASLSTVAPAGWDERAVGAPGGHVMQSVAWAAHRQGQGARPCFLTFDDGGVALAILWRSRLVPGWSAAARRGPPHRGDGALRHAERCIALATWARGEGVIDLFLDPVVDADPAWGSAMEGAGFRVTAEVEPSIHVMRLTLPSDADEASLWAGIARSTRQRITAARKAGTTVRHDETGERLDEFGGLLLDRAADLGIPLAHGRAYLGAWRREIAAGLARLLVAEHDGELVGGLLLYRQSGIHATAYSADRADRRRELPGTMHLVRWTAILGALAEGVPAIELGGVDMPGHREPPRPGDPNWGLFEHKASFGATWVVREPARRIVLRPWLERYASASGRMARAAGSLPGRARR